MARPRSTEETREEMLFIRVTRTELDSILLAVPSDQSISSWSRTILLDQIKGTSEGDTALQPTE